MPTIVRDRRKAFSRMFAEVDRRMEERIQEIAEDAGRLFFQQIMIRQPVGKLDPLVQKGLSRRHVRPSIRLRERPIGQSWVGPEVEQREQRSRDMVLYSDSPHVRFFTMMTGRKYLGIRGSAQTARRHPYLHFWWLGEEWRVKSVGPHGFKPATDFVEDSWLAVVPQVERKLEEGMDVSLMETVRTI